MGRQNKQTFLDDKIKAKTYFDSRIIGLLLKYGVPYNEKKTYYTQRELNEIDEILKKVEDIDEIIKKLEEKKPSKRSSFSYKDCGLLIMNGYYMHLRVFLQNAYKSDEYNSLKNRLDEIYKAMGKAPKGREEPEIPVKKRKPKINKKKLSELHNFVKSAGGLNLEEMRVFISLAGYKIEEGSLTEKDPLKADEDTDIIGI